MMPMILSKMNWLAYVPVRVRRNAVKPFKGFGVKFTEPEYTHFVYRTHAGNSELVQIKVLESHLSTILSVPASRPTPSQWSSAGSIQQEISRKKIESALRELIKKRNHLASLAGAEEAAPLEDARSGALIGITVEQRLSIAKIAGPSVCLGRLIGNDPTQPYIGMWWAKHCWAFTPSHDGLGNVNDEPHLEEVIGYNNSPPTATKAMKQEAAKIAKRWMPKAQEAAVEASADPDLADKRDTQNKLNNTIWAIEALRAGLSLMDLRRGKIGGVVRGSENEHGQHWERATEEEWGAPGRPIGSVLVIPSAVTENDAGLRSAFGAFTLHTFIEEKFNLNPLSTDETKMSPVQQAVFVVERYAKAVGDWLPDVHERAVTPLRRSGPGRQLGAPFRVSIPLTRAESDVHDALLLERDFFRISRGPTERRTYGQSNIQVAHARWWLKQPQFSQYWKARRDLPVPGETDKGRRVTSEQRQIAARRTFDLADRVHKVYSAESWKLVSRLHQAGWREDEVHNLRADLIELKQVLRMWKSTEKKRKEEDTVILALKLSKIVGPMLVTTRDRPAPFDAVCKALHAKNIQDERDLPRKPSLVFSTLSETDWQNWKEGILLRYVKEAYSYFGKALPAARPQDYYPTYRDDREREDF